MGQDKKFILYVDDDQDDQEFFADVIRQHNPDIGIRLAGNGVEALQLLLAEKDGRLPCLIVLDINMPLMDGKETLSRLKADNKLKNIPVIILSSSEKPQDKMLFNSFGIEYFTKPDHISYLGTLASHVLKSYCT